MMRKGRLARLARLGGMAAGFVGDVASAATHSVTQSVTHDDDTRTAEFHRRAAKRMLEVFSEMRGLPLKAGQMLSYIDEMLPAEHRHIYEEVLGRLQVHTPPMGWEVIQEVFHEEFDGKGPEEIFARFDHEPIAAASIGQVYRAALADGTEVVVKVQYPGVAEAMTSDLNNAETMVSLMNAIVPKMSFAHFVGDIAHRLMEEVDYTLEAKNQADFRALWQGDSQVIIPRVYADFSTRRVLTSEYLDGQEWKDMLASADADLKSSYGRTIFRFVFGSLFNHGMFNGDPHPGNYLFYPDGRVAFIDYGCVQRYDEAAARAFNQLRYAVLEDVAGPRFRRLLIKAFGVPEDLDEEMADVIVEYMRLTFQPVTAPQPYTFTREYSRQLLLQMMELKKSLNKKVFFGSEGNVDIWGMRDAGVTFLGRINFGLGSILATLGASGDFHAIVEGME